MNWSEETSNSEYGKTKFLAEMEVWRGIGEGLNAVIVNPVIILGRG
jgi:dihydroflavonol-4-reductase